MNAAHEADAPAPRPARTSRAGFVTTAIALLLPLAGLALLIAQPQLDLIWEHHPAHFWLVLAIGGINAVLAWATGSAARVRGDARLVLVSLSFLAAAGFLALHALATPGVMLATSNAGFAIATPVGLLLASGFAAASSLDFDEARTARVMRAAPWLLWGFAVVFIVWGVLSLLRIGPFDTPNVPERAGGAFIGIAVVTLALYAFAVARYLRIPRQGTSALPLALAAAFTLLAEAQIAIVWGRNWHASWWEWHVLMLIAFVTIAVTAQRSWREERWAGLYTAATASSEREISVLFADLQGFTAYSERHSPSEVTTMLNAYFSEAIPPIVQRFGGQVDRIVGDAVFAAFNYRGNMPDHAARAAGAALALQQATGALAALHPDWPRFRAGVNTGTAAVGLVGTGGGRTYTAIGDVVNVASRLEGLAPIGGVAISAATLDGLTDAIATPLGDLPVAGREQPVTAYRLLSLGE